MFVPFPARTPTARRILRGLVLLVASLETILLVGYIGLFLWYFLGSSDALGRSIASGVAALAAIPLIAFALPALVLVLLDRWLLLALLLLALSVATMVLLFRYA
jgi:hypothetical protein